MSTRRPRGLRPRFLVLLLAGALALSGCSTNFDVYKLPLPGGADLGADPITVTARFTDVLDLVPKSSVKVNDVTVGEITDVSLDGQTAMVTMKVRSDTGLPDNSYARIRQTSLLGEKFVSLEPPPSGAEGTLGQHDILLDHTNRNPEIEEVLGALSLLLNGGGIAQLRTIAREINQTLGGREDAARSVLTQIKTFTGQLDDHKTDIVSAITSLNRLSKGIRRQQSSIDGALEALPSALRSLDSQRRDLVKMLTALDQLSTVGVRVIKRSKATTIESLRQLQPVLTQLANSGDAFVNSINVSLTYPFVDEVVGRDPQVARNLQVGDYTNLSVELDVDLTNLAVPGLPCTTIDQIPVTDTIMQILNLPNLCDGVNAQIQKCANHPTIKNCVGVPAGIVTAACEALATGLLTPYCTTLLGTLPTLPGTGGGGGGPLPGVPNLPGLPGVPDLPNVPNLPGGGLGGVISGLGGKAGNRVAFGGTGTHASRTPDNGIDGPEVGQLMQTYDPALVTLMTPGMVLR